MQMLEAATAAEDEQNKTAMIIKIVFIFVIFVIAVVAGVLPAKIKGCG